MSATSSTVVIPAAISFSRMVFAELGDLLDGRGRTAGERLHLLLDFLALLFFRFDVDFPVKKLGGKAYILAFFADCE